MLPPQMASLIPAWARTVKSVKRLVYSSALGSMRAPRYPYMFSPVELKFLCDCLERAAATGGCFAEIGCFRGDTTIFLNKYLDDIQSREAYYAFDTFDGFTPEDVEFESTTRGKDRGHLLRGFGVNEERTFVETMRKNGCDRVRTVRVDANHYDFPELDGCAFCLIDVDLYRPVLAALKAVYPRCAPGATIVVDDCRDESHLYDGASQGYREFIGAMGLAPRVIHGKLGVVEKPRS